MDLVKKNIISIVCGVIALAALVVAFTILPSHASQLKQQLEERERTYTTLHGLLQKDRQLPGVNPDNPEQQKLTKFPSQRIIDQGNALTKQVEAESNAIRNEAVKLNTHVLLVPGCLPQPSNPQAIAFRNAYQLALPMPAGGGVMKSRFAQDLKAGMPPTPEEIHLKQDELAKKIKAERLFINAQGVAVNQPQVDQEIRERGTELPKQLMEQAAKGSRVYVNQETFEIYPRIAAAAGAPDPVDMYFAQLSYWIQEDVVSAVNDVNGKSTSVADSPVKHLLSIRARSSGVPNFVLPTATAADAAAAAQASGDPDGTLPKHPAVSPTGRVCNGLYDVFHFTVTADVEAAKLGDFLRGLGYRRFITPLWVDVKAVDNAAALSHGYVYGEKPVLTVTAECEVLYLRKWDAPLMPKLIRTRLGIADEQPAVPGQPAPAAPASPGAP